MKATETTGYLCEDDAGVDVLSAVQSSSQEPGAHSEKASIHAGANNLTTTREVSASLQHALSTHTNLEKLPASRDGNTAQEGTEMPSLTRSITEISAIDADSEGMRESAPFFGY